MSIHSRASLRNRLIEKDLIEKGMALQLVEWILKKQKQINKTAENKIKKKKTKKNPNL